MAWCQRRSVFRVYSIIIILTRIQLGTLQLGKCSIRILTFNQKGAIQNFTMYFYSSLQAE